MRYRQLTSSLMTSDYMLLRIPNPVECAWLAGFFDGEGYIDTRANGKNAHSLYMTLTQKHPTILHEIQQQFGGGLSPDKGKPGVYRLWWYNREAAVLFRLLMPYLRIKRVKGLIAVRKFYATRLVKPYWPPRIKATRRRTRARMCWSPGISDDPTSLYRPRVDHHQEVK